MVMLHLCFIISEREGGKASVEGRTRRTSQVMFRDRREVVERVVGGIIQRMGRAMRRGERFAECRVERKGGRGVERERRWRVQRGMVRWVGCWLDG